MEALATLSLVCNITQLVEEGLSLAELYMKVRTAGSSSENQRLQDLMTTAATVEEAYITLDSPQPLDSVDSRIKDIARKSTAASRELNRCLHNLMYKDDTGTFPRSSADTFWRTLRRRSHISELYKQYEGLQMVLQTSLLGHVRHLLLQTRDEHTKELITIRATSSAVRRLLEGNSGIAATASVAIHDFKLHYENSMQQLEMRMEARVLEERRRSAKDRFLASLDFDGRLERVDQIEARVGQNHETAKWIFVDPDKQTLDETACSRSHTPDVECEVGDDGGYGPVSAGVSQNISDRFQRPQMTQVRIRFTDWLRSGGGIFHLFGKAGSGKSCFMASIHEELLVTGLGHEHLSQWKPDMPLIILSFFFFKPSPNRLLKTSQGLWRSLCYQILIADSKVAQAAKADTQAPQGLRSSLRDFGPVETVWRSHELFQWFLFLVARSSSKFIVLLDGLDELDEYSDGDLGHSDLLDHLERVIGQSDNLKFLCASRADQPFKKRLSKYPSLKLQDVNYHDIRLFCQKELVSTRAAKFIDEIASRAEGVFLWAWLVAKDLSKAADRNVSDEELRLRLDAYPLSMNQLYEHMLERQDHFYKSRPQPFLRLIEFAHTHNQLLSAFELLLSTIPEPALAKVVSNVFDDELVAQLNDKAKGFEEQVVLRCAGLVEFQESHYFAQRQIFSSSKAGIEPLRRLLSLEVSFVHRSALDFLHEEGRKFLEQVHVGNIAAARIIGLAHIGHLCLDDTNLLSIAQEPKPFYSAGYEPLRYAALFDDAVQYDIYDSFEGRLRHNLLERNMFSRDRDAFDFMGLKFWHSKLPSSINLAAALGMMYGTRFFDSRTVPFIQSLNQGVRSTAAAYALCHIWSRAPDPVSARLCELLELTSPTTRVRWLPDAATELTLWQHFVCWGWWRLFKQTGSSQRSLEITRRFLEQGADPNADFMATLHIFGRQHISIHPVIPGAARKKQEDDEFLVCGKSNSMLTDLASSDAITLFSASVTTSWRPARLTRVIKLSSTSHDLEAILVNPLLKRSSDHRGSPLSRWASIAIASLNENLPSLSQHEPDDLREAGFGFHEGTICHHWSTVMCQICGYQRD